MDIGSNGTGIVICPPFGQEAMLTYRGCKILAERLHARGFSVLRFDYPGTGDSAGSETDPSRLETWQLSVSSAVTFLRRAAGVEAILLIGVRLGAALALQAVAQDNSIIAVCCLAPVVSGRSYARELNLLANGWREANLLPQQQAGAGYRDIVGDRLSEETLQAISAIDLRAIAVTATDVMLVEACGTPSIDSLATHLRKLGARVTHEDFPGAATFLQDAFSVTIPDRTFTKVVAWCESLPRTNGQLMSLLPPSSRALHLPTAIEEGFQFGPENGLYGVLCSPSQHCATAAPTVIMLNTGFGRRTGDGRVYVTLARRLANMGIPSLRIDGGGFGESAARNNHTLHPYAPELIDDVVAAVEALAIRGLNQFILVAICSGAHVAFHASLRETRVNQLILANLQKFIWLKNAPLKVENKKQRRPLTFYLKAVMRKEAWERLLRGNVAVGSISAALVRRLFLNIYHWASLLFERTTGFQTRAGQVRRWLSGLGRRGVRINFLYSEEDPGLSELSRAVGSRSYSREQFPHLSVELIPRADHALLDYAARQHFIDRICQFVADGSADWTM
ncbi:serine aminopeptidase domain-containing protein [Acidisoma silvae]|uniref:Alpha/beta hydrolase n=1 Tax=Acidisoma silvae TaxID=2802396 RepID=A0A963YVZ9_9PROT|nr:alpha/beta hydrolase [Acidisoma silvae]MCB8878149.1 alpha/beta hydrolase [Acidisoma silvae]